MLEKQGTEGVGKKEGRGVRVGRDNQEIEMVRSQWREGMEGKVN